MQPSNEMRERARKVVEAIYWPADGRMTEGVITEAMQSEYERGRREAQAEIEHLRKAWAADVATLREELAEARRPVPDFDAESVAKRLVETHWSRARNSIRKAQAAQDIARAIKTAEVRGYQAAVARKEEPPRQ